MSDRPLWTVAAMAQAMRAERVGMLPQSVPGLSIVPADRKWLRNLVMLETVVATLGKMNPKYPAAEFDPKEITIK